MELLRETPLFYFLQRKQNREQKHVCPCSVHMLSWFVGFRLTPESAAHSSRTLFLKDSICRHESLTSSCCHFFYSTLASLQHKKTRGVTGGSRLRWHAANDTQVVGDLLNPDDQKLKKNGIKSKYIPDVPGWTTVRRKEWSSYVNLEWIYGSLIINKESGGSAHVTFQTNGRFLCPLTHHRVDNQVHSVVIDTGYSEGRMERVGD